MRHVLAAAVLLGLLGGFDPAWAVLTSSSLVITDQGRPIPAATILLSHPHPRAARAPSQKPAAPMQQYSQQPAPASPAPAVSPQPAAKWVTAQADMNGRALLQFDNQDTPPGMVVDVTVFYPNGETRQLYDIPVETILAGGRLEMSGLAAPPAGYAGPPPPDQPPSGGFVPNFGISIGRDWGRGRDR